MVHSLRRNHFGENVHNSTEIRVLHLAQFSIHFADASSKFIYVKFSPYQVHQMVVNLVVCTTNH